jgi:hypothetical protein
MTKWQIQLPITSNDQVFEQSAFYLLLCKYLDTQTKLDEVKSRVEQARSETDYSQVWELEEVSVTLSAPCRDRIALQETLQYQKSVFNEAKAEYLQNNFEVYSHVLYKVEFFSAFSVLMGRILCSSYLNRKWLNWKWICTSRKC